jgi:hypothetical protein
MPSVIHPPRATTVPHVPERSTSRARRAEFYPRPGRNITHIARITRGRAVRVIPAGWRVRHSTGNSRGHRRSLFALSVTTIAKAWRRNSAVYDLRVDFASTVRPPGGIITCDPHRQRVVWTPTVEPNKVGAPVHDRMPLIVPPEYFGRWLGFETPVAELRTPLNPHLAAKMESHRVGKAVGKVKTDGPECIAPGRARDAVPSRGGGRSCSGCRRPLPPGDVRRRAGPHQRDRGVLELHQAAVLAGPRGRPGPLPALPERLRVPVQPPGRTPADDPVRGLVSPAVPRGRFGLDNCKSPPLYY